MKKIIFTFLLLFSSLMVVDATSMSGIDVDIFIDKNGDAHFREIWDINVTKDTELFHSYKNISGFEFSDLSVSMDNTDFETISNWDIKANFNDKAYKAGFNHIDDGIEICFGISEYGNHKYVVKYTVENFVLKLNDADMIYWEIIPKNLSWTIDDVKIKIYSDFKYDNHWGVWGYGKYAAPCYIYDGIIEMTSDNKVLKSGEYLTILAKFPKDTFSSRHVLDEAFDYYLKMAEKGSTSYKGKNGGFGSVIGFLIDFLASFAYVIFWGICLFAAFIFGKKKNKVRFGAVGNKVRKDVLPFREIPCDKDIFRAYWVANNYNLSKKKEDFLGSVILKWLKDGNIRIEKVSSKGLFKEKVENNIIFDKRPDSAEVEGRLYDYMVEASGDSKLESNEFKKWCRNHYTKILNWFDDVLDYENKMLVNDGKAQYVTVGKVFKNKVYQIDDSMMEEAEKMAGLKLFLKEFSVIDKREPIEVSLWNEYLMYAQIFGIADEVASQFKKLYPEVIQEMESMGYGYNDILFIHSISADGIKSAVNKAQSYNSGGGGFSAGGGGFGSFGGGGGMGSR